MIQMIPLDRINAKDTSFSYQNKITDIERIKVTIKKITVADPVYLLVREKVYIILDGFTRVNVLKDIHINKKKFFIPAFVFTPQELTYPNHISIIMKQDLQSPLSFAEKVNAFNLLKREYSQIQPHQILRDLSLPPGNDYKIVYDALGKVTVNWLDFFARHRVPGRRIKTIVQSDDLNVFEPLLTLELGINKLEQAVIMLSESAKRDNIKITDLIKKLMPLSSEKAQSDQFFYSLFEYRYPLMSAYQKKMSSILKEMNVPGPVKVEYDKIGETPGIKVVFHIHQFSDLEVSENWLSQYRSKIMYFLNERLKL